MASQRHDAGGAGVSKPRRSGNRLKRGYVQDLASAQAGKVDAVIEGSIFPCWPTVQGPPGSKIMYPAYAQPKLDGAPVYRDGRVVVRTRKPVVSVPPSLPR